MKMLLNLVQIIIPEKSIRFYDDYTPIIIGNDQNSNGFYLKDNKICDNGLLNNTKIYDFQKNNELTEKLNKLIDLEIFEINYK